MKWNVIAVILPITLGVASVFFLIQSRVIDFSISLPADLDVIVVLSGVAVSSFLAINMALAEGRERLRRESVKQVRNDAFAEHQRFLRRLDHELKNPLLAIRAELENLSVASEHREQHEMILHIESQLQRIGRLIADLRKLVDLETIELELSPVDIPDLLREALLLFQDRSDAQERKLILSLPTPPATIPLVTADQDLLLLSLHNLIDNALKFTGPGDTVKLQAYTKNERIIIEVIDTGVGISESEIPLVWEELYREKSVITIPGTGIGLALVLAVVQRHRGEIGLESELGQGTVVRISLPQA